MDLVYIHPGGVRTGIAFFYFDKVSFMKHPSEHVEVLYQRSAAIYTEVLHIWLNMAYFDMAAFVLNVVFYRDVGSKSVA